MIWEITQLSFYFSALMLMVVRLFLLACILAFTGSYVVLFLVFFYSVAHSASSK